MDLLNIKPTKVSANLNAYTIYLFGVPKIGKTTFAKDAGALILATEKGYSALSGAYVVDITKWSDVRQIARELKKDEVKEKYKVIAIDTLDNMASLCEKYVCAQNDISALGELPYGQGWALYKSEFYELFNSISMMGYSLLFISHNKEKVITKQDNTSYNVICATASGSINEQVKTMADIICYAYQDPTDQKRYLLLRSLDGSVDVGSRHAYIDPVINFSYKDLQKALNKAIEKEAEINGEEAVESAEEKVIEEKPKITFEQLIEKFNADVAILMEKDQQKYTPILSEIIQRYLGKGKRVNEATERQYEMIECIVGEIEDTLLK